MIKRERSDRFLNLGITLQKKKESPDDGEAEVKGPAQSSLLGLDRLAAEKRKRDLVWVLSLDFTIFVGLLVICQAAQRRVEMRSMVERFNEMEETVNDEDHREIASFPSPSDSSSTGFKKRQIRF